MDNCGDEIKEFKKFLDVLIYLGQEIYQETKDENVLKSLGAFNFYKNRLIEEEERRNYDKF